MQGCMKVLTGEANGAILVGDFGIGPIRIDNVLSTESNVQTTLDLSACP